MTDQPTESQERGDLARERTLQRETNKIKTGIAREVFEANQIGLDTAARNHNREILLGLRGPWAWKISSTEHTNEPQT